MDDDSLIRALLAEPESEWIEYKHNNDNPEEIGEYLSAMANAAALHQKEAGYIVWGVEDGTRNVVGTTFQPRARKVKGQELESWLLLHTSPTVNLRIIEGTYGKKPIVVFEVTPARQTP